MKKKNKALSRIHNPVSGLNTKFKNRDVLQEPMLYPDPRTRKLADMLYQRPAHEGWIESSAGGVWIGAKASEDRPCENQEQIPGDQ